MVILKDSERCYENKKIEVSVVMPCLNEEETVGICIEKIKKAFKTHNINGEIVVSDNGSSDRSVQIATELGVRVVKESLKGYGNAYIKGIKSALGKYIVMGDADNTYDFSQIDKFIEPLKQDVDMVVGSRLKGKINKGAMPFLHRYIGNPLLSKILSIMFKSKISDAHCGMRSFKKETFDKLGLKSPGMEFASEMIIKAAMTGIKIIDIPIDYHTRVGESKLRTFKDGWRHLRFMFLFSPRWLFLIPGALLLIGGSIAGGILVFGNIKLGNVIFETNTLLLCVMAVLVGFQLILFALFTKVFAISEGLLPKDLRIDKVASVITLEVGLLIGFIFVLVGLGLILWIFWIMRVSPVANISSSENLKTIIPGITILTLGVEIIFSSFFLSILGMKQGQN